MFLDAVEDRFGPIRFDLAALPENAVVPDFFTPSQDSLAQSWEAITGLAWLNPPFKRIAPWVRKAAMTDYSGGLIVALLVPASIGSNWFADHVHGKAQVLALRPRLTFVGHKHAFPKDLCLLLYGTHTPKSFDLWKWK